MSFGLITFVTEEVFFFPILLDEEQKGESVF